MAEEWQEVDDDCAVFRLIGCKPLFWERNGVDFWPSADAFKLSSRDEASVPPGLTVWDLALTTADEARSRRTGDGDCIAFSAAVGALKATAAEHGRSIRVIRTPLEGLGGEGHCDILGLDKAARKAAGYKERFMRAALANLLRPMEPIDQAILAEVVGQK